MLEKVIAIFDIGKTNKKVLLFNEELKVVYQQEQKLKTINDEDGFECDDLNLIEIWILDTLSNLIKTGDYDIVGVNFSTYGASLLFIDDNSKPLTPLYNYLKEIPCTVQENLFERYGGQNEFCRKTASPALGLLLNSGLQILWVKQFKPDIFSKTKGILHFPQYLSYKLTKQVVSESTSIGCHTFLWDFDGDHYHDWLNDEKISLPEPLPNSHAIPVVLEGKELACGIGIHDSSASLAPYVLGSKSNFLLVSTGTWCINMNPFNHEPLTAHQLKNDCLAYLSIGQKPVKSSRLFMGHIHDVNTNKLTDFFKVPENYYKSIKPNVKLISKYLEKGETKVFFKDGVSDDYIDATVNLAQFADFDEAYHRLMYDLTLLNKNSMDLILGSTDEVELIYISGGFARNEIFVRLLANFYPDKKVFTSEVDNASALGAAMVVRNALPLFKQVNVDLGLKQWLAFE